MSKLHELLSNNADDEEILSLIDAGADVNEANVEDCYIRPMQLAVNCKRSEQIIRALVNAGADVNACATEDDLNDEDQEAVDDGLDMRGDLFDYFSDLSPLCLAVSNNDIATMTLLIDLGAKVNRTCRQNSADEIAPIGMTNKKETLEALIKLGANVNLTYGYGRDTANKLCWDLNSLDVEAVMLLLRAGSGYFGDRRPSESINSYIVNHPEADADLIRDLIRRNTIEHFDYDPFENA